MDSNHRRRKPADLQSAPFGHSGICPTIILHRASCRIRTNDPEITNHVLWPTELKRQVQILQPFARVPSPKRLQNYALFLILQNFGGFFLLIPLFFLVFHQLFLQSIDANVDCFFKSIADFVGIKLSIGNDNLYSGLLIFCGFWLHYFQ